MLFFSPIPKGKLSHDEVLDLLHKATQYRDALTFALEKTNDNDQARARVRRDLAEHCVALDEEAFQVWRAAKDAKDRAEYLDYKYSKILGKSIT